MQRTSRTGGFTLIELLVVIAILGLLIATFAPDIFGAKTSARIAADQANLRFHYQQMEHYSRKMGNLPVKVGHDFVLAPWVDRIVQRTPQNFERYWQPEMPDPRKEELASQDMETIWTSYDDVDSDDTHYAGPGEELIRGLRLGNGKLPLMSNDNEYVPAFEDHTINVLLGDGHILELVYKKDLEPYNVLDPEDPSDAFPVGPESPHPLLQKLQK